MGKYKQFLCESEDIKEKLRKAKNLTHVGYGNYKDKHGYNYRWDEKSKKFEKKKEDLPFGIKKERELASEIPSKGSFPAIVTKAGDIYVDKKTNSTHILFAERLGLTPDMIRTGGWLKDGVYDESSRSDIIRWKEQYDAKKRVEEIITKRKKQ